MATFTERNGRYLVRVRLNGYPTVTKTFTRKSDGVAWARGVETDMERRLWVVEPKAIPSLKIAISEYRRTVAASMKGAADYAYRFDEFEASALAQKSVDNITPSDLCAWRDLQSETRKPGTVVRKMAMLSAIFSWCAKERGWIDRNPMSLVSRPRVSDSRDRTLNPDEVRYLLAAARTSKATWLNAALIVLIRSAMRRSELFGLTIGDIDFERAVARLNETKNGTARDVPLCPQALQALRELVEAARARSSLSLLPIGSVGSFSTRFVRTVDRAREAYRLEMIATGLEDDPQFLRNLRLHDLRHHAVSAWANTGALSIVELMGISGHKSPRMLTRYVHMKSPAIATKMATLLTDTTYSE